MIGLAVVVGYFVSKPAVVSPLALVLGYVTGFAICGFSMVMNDYYDIEVDRVNQPTRPLPSGALSPREAVGISLVMLAVGVAATLLLGNSIALVVVVVYASLAWLYDYRAKKYGLAGNLIVASSLAIPFIYGGVISGGAVLDSLLLFMALTSFLSGVGREVVKAMADVAGDEKRGVRSYARVHGLRGAAAVGAAFFVGAVVTSLLPLLVLQVNVFYRVGVLVPDVIFVYLTYRILRGADVRGALSVKRFALFGMLVGLIVFIGGAF
jgi:geranylgeranylglycerol-phosphate geranylgeranyltransferase